VIENMTATAQLVPTAKLSPKSLDELCARREQIQGELDEIATILKDQVDQFGYTPARAEKSKRLEGKQFEITLCSSEGTEIRDTAVEAIERVTPLDLFSKLFRKVTSYKLQPGASMVLAGTLPQGAPSNLRKLFAQAVLIKPKAPSLRVKRIGEEDGPSMATSNR
jgi:hypothetical protein